MKPKVSKLNRSKKIPREQVKRKKASKLKNKLKTVLKLHHTPTQRRIKNPIKHPKRRFLQK